MLDKQYIQSAMLLLFVALIAGCAPAEAAHAAASTPSTASLSVLVVG